MGELDSGLATSEKNAAESVSQTFESEIGYLILTLIPYCTMQESWLLPLAALSHMLASADSKLLASPLTPCPSPPPTPNDLRLKIFEQGGLYTRRIQWSLGVESHEISATSHGSVSERAGGLGVAKRV